MLRSKLTILQRDKETNYFVEGWQACGLDMKRKGYRNFPRHAEYYGTNDRRKKDIHHFKVITYCAIIA